MKLGKPKKQLFIVTSVLATVALAVIAVMTAIRLQQIGTEPVAPSVPKSKPKAQEVSPTAVPTSVPTPGADSQCRVSWVFPSPTPGPSSTPTPTGVASSPTPTGALSCVTLDIPGGTSRKTGEEVRFICSGSPASQVTQCRFRFGDGSSEVFEDDCNTLYTYNKVGTYKVSCETRDTGGFWRASSACGGSVEIAAAGVTSGPTTTVQPTAAATAIPTVAQQELPEAGGIGQTVGALIGGLGVIILGLLLLL